MNQVAAPGGISSRIWGLGLTGLALTVALALYQPWGPRPFDILDFSEFLPLLREEGGPGDRLGRLLEYYIGTHGRFNVVSYIALVAKWELLGDHPELWRWARLFQMLALTGGIYLLFRRLGAARVGAAVGSGLFVGTRIAGEAWTRLTMGEPLALCFLVGAMHLAVGWRTDATHRRGAWIGGLVVAAVLAKEMAAGVVPLVLAIGIFRDEDGRFGPAIDPRATRRLLGWVLGPAVLSFGAAAVVALGAPGEGFATLYGTGTDPITRFFDGWQRPWQIQGFQPAPASWALPANTLLATLTLWGLLTLRRAEAASRRHGVAVAAIAVALGAIYSALYLPWPFVSLYYALPFLLGPALLLATALTAIEGASARLRPLAYAVAAPMLLAAAVSTARVAHTESALDEIDGEIVSALLRYPEVDSFVVARPERLQYAWLGPGPDLRRAALAGGAVATLPPAVNTACADAGRMFSAPPTAVVVISYLHRCGPLPVSTTRMRRTRPYASTTWRGIVIGVDTLGADLWDLRVRPAAGGAR